jgi:hypothetical protein
MAKKIILHKGAALAGSGPAGAAASAPAAADEPAIPYIGDLEGFRAGLPPGERLTCPACRATCAAEDALFIAHDERLPYDLVLGPGHAYRFRPSRFTPDGAAIDPGGVSTTDTACPACHAAWSGTVTLPGAAVPRPGEPRDKNAPERLPPALATLDGIRKLVAEIVSLVNRTGSARILGEVNARQYAELCRRANARLELCRQFLQARQPGAALDQAEQPPPLLELCAALPFEDLSQWGQLCARSRWAIAEPVNTAAVLEVQAGVADARKLEPAFQALRASIRRNLPYETLCVLRTLLHLDPDNPLWRTDVEAFERARQQELFAAAIIAIEADDVAALTAPATELAGPWLLPPDPELRESVQSAFDRLRRTDAAQRGQSLANQFLAACSSEDFETAEAAHRALETLTREGFYHPDEAARQHLAGGRSWFTAIARQRAEDEAFARDLAALTEAVAKTEAIAEVERLYPEILRTGRSAPAELMAQANTLIRRHHAQQRRRRLLIRTGQAAVVAAALLLLGSAGWALARRQHRSSVCQRLEQHLKNKNLSAFDGETEAISKGLGRLMGLSPATCPPLGGLITRRNELAARLQTNAATFQETLTALQQDQTRRYTLPARDFLLLLERAKQAARTIQDLAAIEAIETPWRADQNARLAEALATTLPSITPPDTNLFATLPFPEASRQLVQYVAQIDAVAGLAGADPKELSKAAPYLEIANTCRTNVALRLAALQGIASATNLDLYLDTLVRYAHHFTNDTLSVQLAETLNSRREYRTALQHPAKLQEQIARLATNNAWAQARDEILELRKNKSLNSLRWVCRKENNELIFLLEREKPEASSRGSWAECYQPLSGDTSPSFQRARVTDAPPYREGLSDHPSRLWFHTEIINDMLARTVNLHTMAEGERFLEEQFRLIGATPVWNPRTTPGTNDLPNLAFQIQFLSFLAGHLGQISAWPEWQTIFAELRSADIPEASWLCVNGGDVKRINQAGALAMPRIFAPGGLLERLQLRRAAAEQLARTPLTWAGYATPSDAPPQLRWPPGAKPPVCLIVLRPDAAHARMIAVDAGPPAKPLLPLVPGEPLLTWADGGPTRPKIELLRQATGINDPAPLLPPWFPAPVRP